MNATTNNHGGRRQLRLAPRIPFRLVAGAALFAALFAFPGVGLAADPAAAGSDNSTQEAVETPTAVEQGGAKQELQEQGKAAKAGTGEPEQVAESERFVDRDGDGIQDGQEDRFRRKRGSHGRHNGAGEGGMRQGQGSRFGAGRTGSGGEGGQQHRGGR